ncbi:hypothetical protein WAI453_005372 [Rhynchosporium graminicola]|uniref:Uncharacterized protein n=1 Tax=Rhynchosporium graminicola TaxID=2792576 RepID=A0A1E1LRX5_9HELO|nr:uncharacterized protein RCO7_05271 [Rhynchosporium commune]
MKLFNVLLVLLAALWLATAQDLLPNAQPLQLAESADVILVTVTTVASVTRSYETSVVVFVTSDASGIVTLTTITKDPGPPDTFVNTFITISTREKTVRVSGSLQPTKGASPSFTSGESPATPNTSTTTKPGASVPPTSTSNAQPTGPSNDPSKILIILCAVIAPIAGVITWFGVHRMSAHRAQDEADRRSAAAYRRSLWNPARPAVSSPLRQVNVTEMDVMTAPQPNIESPSNMAPKIPARPASISGSLLESMRTTPSASMRLPRSARPGSGTPAMMSGALPLSPGPLSIVKKDLNRPDTRSSTTGQFDDARTHSSTDVDSAQLDALQAIEDELSAIEIEHRHAEAEGSIAPLLLKSSNPIAEDDTNDTHSATAAIGLDPTHTAARIVPRLTDPDDSSEEIRLARRTSAERKLNGESIRADSTSPRVFDPIAARAQRLRIANEQRKIAERQKKEAGGSGNVTVFSAGPMPAHPPPPTPGLPPPNHF